MCTSARLDNHPWDGRLSIFFLPHFFSPMRSLGEKRYQLNRFE